MSRGRNHVDGINLGAMFAQHARRHPHRNALVVGDTQIKWPAFNRRVTRIATALLNRGVSVGDIIGILGPTDAAYVEIYCGIICSGACAVPLPSTLAPADLQRMIGDAGLKILFCLDARGPQAERRLSGIQTQESTPQILVGRRTAPHPDFAIFLQTGSATMTPVRCQPEAPFNIIYSSGTTQSPKGIVQSHAMRSFQIQRMMRLGMGDGCRTILATPLYSNTTIIGLLPTLAAGGTTIILAKFESREYLRHCQRFGVTHTIMVPIQYQRIASHPDFSTFNLTAFQCKFSTGSAMATSQKTALIDYWPGRLVEIYGQTEGGCTTVLDVAAHPSKRDSVGRPAAGVDVRIIDAGGAQLPPNHIGEIVGRAKSMMTEYHRCPEQTEQLSWRDNQGHRFYRTGDLGSLDEDNFLFLRGRKKEVIISGGVNIYPADLETTVAKHPEVTEVAVIGIPSETWGETPLAWVVLSPGAASQPNEIKDWANRRLGKTQRIRRIEMVDALPHNAGGKIDKRQLYLQFTSPGKKPSPE